jgi:flagellum-specific peptidoglycan hydrolase FlgJ
MLKKHLNVLVSFSYFCVQTFCKMPRSRFCGFVLLSLALLTLYSCGAKRRAASTSQPPRSAGSVQEAYINRYKDMAINSMNRNGVPASITLAQGMLESDYGRSRLAVQANNHFGIKCHNGWTGATITHDDDRRNECFRRYRSVEESFNDHSNFLATTPRYRDLFKLKTDDYKGWARGLRQAGYATNPNYANLLIRIIEENDLWRYDQGYRGSARPQAVSNTSNRASVATANTVTGNTNQFAVPDRVSRVRENNRIRYIVVNERDTRESIERDFNMLRRELSRYNELDNNFTPQSGQILYLQPKRNKAEAGKTAHNVTNGDSMYSISQQYGIKLKKLYAMNRMREGDEPKVGDRVRLR